MLKKIVPAVILLALITVAIVQAMDNEPNVRVQDKDDKLGGLKVGLKAPEFELETLAGEEVKLSDFQGKKVMINFWATWCPPCKEEMPDMEELHKKTSDDVVILAVNIDPENDVKGFASDMGVTFPILMDKKSDKQPKLVNEIYQLISIPSTFFLDEEGIIRYKYVGALKLKEMENYISQIK